MEPGPSRIDDPRARVSHDQVVHYMLRWWDDNGDTYCGIRVWFQVRLRAESYPGNESGELLPREHPAQVTCIVCIAKQASGLRAELFNR